MNLAGQVYFTLLQARQERGIKDVAISRVEQLSPFPYDMVRRAAVLTSELTNEFRSLPTLINIPMLIFSGAKKSL